FPAQLRVHLGTTNIRDVVHKRLLKKKPERVAGLRALFQQHRGDLKLYGYGCEAITEEDFCEVYPMLPGHIDLLMQITSNLRSRSTRVQGDDHAIRGLLQLLGELFREQKLADQPLGELVTLDSIFEVQQSALDADVQATLSRILSHAEVQGDTVAQRVAKAVALLELIQEQTPTTPELVATCLYARLGEGNRVPAITEALEKLRSLNLLSYSEKTGFKIQSSAGQEWERERQDYPVTIEVISEIVQTTLKVLVGSMQERPKYKGRSFPWALWFSDGRQAHDVKLMDAREDSTVVVDFRYLKDGREAATWVQRSAQEQLHNRVVWVVGDGAIESAVRDLGRSRKMVERYKPRWASLPKAKQQLVLEEEARLEDLEKQSQRAIASAFHEGTFYFRGQQLRPRDLGAAFTSAIVAIANRILPELYPHTTDLLAVTDTEILQLLEVELSGPSTKFLDGGLGILGLDDQKYIATCKGEHPKRIATEIQKTGGISGQTLIATFIGPPYGYPSDLVRACCAGLLRGKHVRIRNEAGDEITSYRDAGVKDLFTKDRTFRKAEFFPPAEDPITPRDRIAIAKFFDSFLDAKLDREDEAFADAAFKYFPHQRDLLRDVERRFDELPGRPALPERLGKLAKALEDCCRHRPIQKIVVELKRNLDALRDGMAELQILKVELTEPAVGAVQEAAKVRDYHLAQLAEASELSGLEADAAAIGEHFRSETPWRAIHEVSDACERVRERYVEIRKGILSHQSKEAERAQARVRVIPGFEALTADQAHRVLKPILDAPIDTSPEAVSPTLVVLRESFQSRIGPAEELARDRLDEERNRVTEQKIVKVETNLRGREVQSREQLHGLFRELEERIGPLLDQGDRVRIW
ncbi:MAG: BREX system P-loop protein BrxC, partial [Polyangiaceae bacterium]|nr:BREX system P-loop protein BrxC [Polyangiaceae bacterium]